MGCRSRLGGPQQAYFACIRPSADQKNMISFPEPISVLCPLLLTALSADDGDPNSGSDVSTFVDLLEKHDRDHNVTSAPGSSL